MSYSFVYGTESMIFLFSSFTRPLFSQLVAWGLAKFKFGNGCIVSTCNCTYSTGVFISQDLFFHYKKKCMECFLERINETTVTEFAAVTFILISLLILSFGDVLSFKCHHKVTYH